MTHHAPHLSLVTRLSLSLSKGACHPTLALKCLGGTEGSVRGGHAMRGALTRVLKQSQQAEAVRSVRHRRGRQAGRG